MFFLCCRRSGTLSLRPKNLDKVMALKLFRLFAFLTIPTILVSSDSVAKTKPTVFSVKDFPLGVGSQWVYLHIDSTWHRQKLQVVVEIVTVKIIGQTQTAEGRPAGIWVREFSGKVDTQYVNLVGDTVFFMVRFDVYTDTSESFQEQEVARFVFPLTVGNTWKGTYGRDSFSVTRKDSIEVNHDDFRQGFLIERSIWIPNSGKDVDYWIVPGVGLVNIEDRNFFTLAMENRLEIWKLINCEIKK